MVKFRRESDKKFVKDFFKLSSKTSINKIIENKK